MKLNTDVVKILDGDNSLVIIKSLLNFFGYYIEDVADYDELDDDMKKAISRETFELITRKETDEEIIVRLFNAINPVKFGFISGSESMQVKAILGINENTSIERLLELRNKIVEYTHKLITSGMLFENSQIKVMDKMSAFVSVIDRFRVKKGCEV